MPMTDLSPTSFVASGFEPVADTFLENFSNGLELGAGFAAFHDGECVIDIQAGFTDRKSTSPWTDTTLVPVYSVSKGISALVIAYLVEQGRIDYAKPLSDYWPEFAAHGKGEVSVAEALSHQAGVPGFVEPIDPELWLTPRALSARLAEEPPQWTPGTGSGYHPLSWGYIAGELVARVSERSLGTLLRDEICAPLGIDFHIGLPASEHERCADLKRPSAFPDLGEITDTRRSAFLTKWASPNRGGAIWREIEIPSANGHGTARAVARLYGAYANGGQIEDRTLFGRAVYDALTRVYTTGPDRVLPFDMSFGAGIMQNSNLAFGPDRATLGHSGWGGSAAFGDSNRNLSAAYVMNKQSNILLGDPRPTRLFASLYGCL
ncbi:MAG: serine hydrolase domain-containing protein [Hyphomonadaceae bacterium]